MNKGEVNYEKRKGFMNEIDLLKKLDHPNIVRIYELYEDNKRFYLTQEICLGGELFDEINKYESFKE